MTERIKPSPPPEGEPAPSEGTPLSQFEWNDEIVGMGFFPDEVALPVGWRWTADRLGR
jgi:hypothetical protein